MRSSRMSGSVGARGGQPPWVTRRMLMASQIVQERMPDGRSLDQMAPDSMRKRAPQVADRADCALRAHDEQRQQDERPASACGAELPLVGFRPPRGGNAATVRRGSAGSGRARVAAGDRRPVSPPARSRNRAASDCRAAGGTDERRTAGRVALAWANRTIGVRFARGSRTKGVRFEGASQTRKVSLLCRAPEVRGRCRSL